MSTPTPEALAREWLAEHWRLQRGEMVFSLADLIRRERKEAFIAGMNADAEARASLAARRGAVEGEEAGDGLR